MEQYEWVCILHEVKWLDSLAVNYTVSRVKTEVKL